MPIEPTLQKKIRLNLSDKFINKENRAELRFNKKDNEHNNRWALGYSFYPKTITPEQLRQHALAGKAFTLGAFKSNTRSKATFDTGCIFGADFDNGLSVSDAANYPFISQYADFVYATPSSTPELQKCRVIFIPDKPVTDVAQWERYQRALLWYLKELEPDMSCKDAARFFYGSKDAESIVIAKIIPLSVLEALAVQMEAELGTLQPERTTADNTRIREQNRANLVDDKKRTRYYNYAAIALDNACLNISTASDGERHTTLFRASANIGNHIGAGMISESECFNALVGAYRGKDSQREIERVVRDALRAGISKPTDTYELDRQWDEKVKAWKKERAKERDNKLPDDLFGHIIHKLENEKTQHATLLTKLHARYIHTSWYDEHIPLSIISALLHLTDTRSETPCIFGKLHAAFLYGLLNPGAFTLPDVLNCYPQYTRRVIQTALDDLCEMNYLRELKTYTDGNTDVLSKDSVNKSKTRGRPARIYTIADTKTVSERIPQRLKQALDIYWRETLQYGTLCELSPEMAMQLGIEEYSALIQARDLAKIGAKQDKHSKKAQWRYKQEMEGDDNGWRGWDNALESEFAIPLNWNKINTVKELRAAILEYWITNVRACNSQIELTRLIGCSSATLSTLYDDFDIATTKQYHDETLEASIVGKDLRPMLNALQRKYRGIPCIVRFKYRFEKGWESVMPERAALEYAKAQPKKDRVLEKVYIKFITPSVQHIMTPREIAQRDKQLAEDAKSQPVQSATPVTKQATQRKTMKPSRQWIGHDFEYLYQWTQLFVFMFTDNLELHGNKVIDTSLYAPANTVLQSSDLGAILRFTLPYTANCLKRQSHDFTGKNTSDYDDELMALFAQRRADLITQLESESEMGNENDEWLEIYRQVDLIEVPF